MKLFSLLVHLRQVASVTEIKCGTVPEPAATVVGRGTLQAGSRLAPEGAPFAPRAWRMLDSAPFV